MKRDIIATLDDQKNILYDFISKSDETSIKVKEGDKIYMYDKASRWGAVWTMKDGFPFFLDFYLNVPSIIENSNDFASLWLSDNSRLSLLMECEHYTVEGIEPYPFISILKNLIISLSLKSKEFKAPIKETTKIELNEEKASFFKKITKFFKK